ncbi:MAG: bacillithiol system redox-active protein YtxJ [Gemmatimonadales bacterium]|nr:bacillithiol system redox-active protein YtxJ [Gemmatimonadales bacterium]
MVDAPLSVLDTEEDLARALTADAAVLYKHCPICAFSALALRQVRRFAQAHPDVPVYVVDVVSQRVLSDQIESTLRVRHQSPQAIVLGRGEVVWNASHLGITTRRLARQAVSNHD